MHIGNHLLHDLLGRGIAAVRDHSHHRIGQRLSRRHQHGSRAHGHAGKDNFGIRAEFLGHELHPAAAIPAFTDAHGDHIAIAAAAGPLVYQQSAAPQSKAPLYAAAHIGFRCAPVAVEHQLDGRAGGILIVSAPQGKAVKGSDTHILMGHSPHLVDPALDPFPIRLIDLPLRELILPCFGVIFPLDVKGHAKADKRYQQNQQRYRPGNPQYEPQNLHTVHGRTPR